MLVVSGDSVCKEYHIGIVVMVVSCWEMACLPRPAIANEVRVGVIRNATVSDEVLSATGWAATPNYWREQIKLIYILHHGVWILPRT